MKERERERKSYPSRAGEGEDEENREDEEEEEASWLNEKSDFSTHRFEDFSAFLFFRRLLIKNQSANNLHSTFPQKSSNFAVPKITPNIRHCQ